MGGYSTQGFEFENTSKGLSGKIMEPDHKAFDAASDNSEYSHWQTLKTLGAYLWPIGRKDLKLRVVLAGPYYCCRFWGIKGLRFRERRSKRSAVNCINNIQASTQPFFGLPSIPANGRFIPRY